MRQTVIHIPSFQGQYKTGLVFSMIEGLKAGEGFKLVCDQDPTELEVVLKDAQIPNLKWRVVEVQGRWEVYFDKVDPNKENVGCCGLCGGHSTKASGR